MSTKECETAIFYRCWQAYSTESCLSARIWLSQSGNRLSNVLEIERKGEFAHTALRTQPEIHAMYSVNDRNA